MSLYGRARWHQATLAGIAYITLAVSLPSLRVSAADLRGRVDTTHPYASTLFAAENAEVALISVQTKRLAGRTFTSTDGRYYFTKLMQGDHWLLLRTAAQATYWTNRIGITSDSVTMTPLFVGELALGYVTDGTSKSGVRPVGDTAAIQNIKCVDYEIKKPSREEKKTICEPPFGDSEDQTGLYHFYAGVRFTNGAYRGIARTIRHPAQLTATSRIITVGPCPTEVKLITVAEEQEGVRLDLRAPSSTSAGGKLEPSQRDREKTAVYHPPAVRQDFVEDHFDFVITKERQQATGRATVRVLEALRPGCPRGAR